MKFLLNSTTSLYLKNFFLFFTSISYGQKIESLYKRDTIYIEFKKNNKNYTKDSFEPNKNNFKQREFYMYSTLKKHQFEQLEYLSFERYENKDQSKILTLKGHFKKKLSNSLIDLSFLDKFTECELINLFHNKVLFLIDESESSCKTKKLYEVHYFGICPAQE
jgi:hypothetical protein